VRRNIALLVLLLGALLTTWLRAEKVLIANDRRLTFTPVPLPPPATIAAHMGPFRLEKAWQVRLGWWQFGGYSALVPLPRNRFLAISDGGNYLSFTAPDAPEGQAMTPRYGPFLSDDTRNKRGVDIESATRDPATGRLWIGMEYRNALVRLDSRWRESGRSRPEAMADWGKNSGPEAMLRLADGRFVALSEGPLRWWSPRRHDAVVFPGDPVTRPGAGRHFVFSGPETFDPVDMAQLPDGRVLVLMRALTWPFPQRFAGRIAIGDPRAIHPGQTWRVTEVARIASTLPVDNFEAMAITPRGDGRLNVWLLSDDNQARLQQTLLWKLVVDPRDLP
jgi:hypothetical protein